MLQVDDLNVDEGIREHPSETSSNNNGTPQTKTIAEFMADAGIGVLNENSTLEQIHPAIQKFATLVAGKDAVWKGLAKNELVKKLKAIKVQGASDIVGKALDINKTSSNKANGEEILLGDPELWPDMVDGAMLADEIVETIQRFIVLPVSSARAISLWILHTWVLDAFYLSPILRITSPTKECGKSNLLILSGHLMPRNFATGNLTTATLYRLVDSFGISLCIDEADQAFNFNEDLISLVNAGYLRKTAYVPRCEGQDNEVKMYSAYCAKLIAGIGHLKETTESRCLKISLKKKNAEESVEKLPHSKLSEFDHIPQKCFRWAEDSIEDLKEVNPTIPEKLSDRQGDNWKPLLAIAELIGNGWPDHARKDALEISGGNENDGSEIRVLILEDIHSYFDENQADSVTSEDLEKYLTGLEDRPWPEYRKGKPITKIGIARLLKPFGIRPEQFRKSGLKERGYNKSSLMDAFSRYLIGTPGTDLKNKDLENSQVGTENESVPSGKSENLFKNNGVPGVPSGNTGTGEERQNVEDIGI